MRGASAIQTWLHENPGERVQVFVVWEPILPTDWQKPSQLLLARISDLRAAQYWDDQHLVSAAIKPHLHPGEPDCCDHEGDLWDLVAVYPKDAGLNTAPTFIGGPVVKSIKVMKLPTR